MTAKEIQKLAQRVASDNDLQNELDEIVHEAAFILASNINNLGPINQIEWLQGQGFGCDLDLFVMNGKGTV